MNLGSNPGQFERIGAYLVGLSGLVDTVVSRTLDEYRAVRGSPIEFDSGPILERDSGLTQGGSELSAEKVKHYRLGRSLRPRVARVLPECHTAILR